MVDPSKLYVIPSLNSKVPVSTMITWLERSTVPDESNNASSSPYSNIPLLNSLFPVAASVPAQGATTMLLLDDEQTRTSTVSTNE